MIAGCWQRYSSRRPLLYGRKDVLVGKDSNGRVLTLHCEGTNYGTAKQKSQEESPHGSEPHRSVQRCIRVCIHGLCTKA